MDTLRDLLLRLQEMGWLDALPPALQRPPALWILLAVLSVAGLLLLAFLFRLAGRIVFGQPPNHSRRADGDMRRAVKEDLAELERQGNLLGLGELYEDLGQAKKALAAYRKGGHDEPRAALLAKLGKRREARKLAQEAGLWRLYAEICQEDGDLDEAAVAFERDGQAYLAARCYEASERRIDAARCYVAAGMEGQAVSLLGDQEGPEVAELLDRALRASIASTGVSGLSLALEAAVQRTVQLWLAASEPRRAFELAVLAEKLELAVPVARDFLEPEAEAAEVCERAGAPLVAAHIWRRLGESKRAALLLAEHHRDRGDAAEAARQYEEAEALTDAAEQWAALGESQRAADLFQRAGDLHSAAQIYAQSGDTVRSQQMLSQAHALSVEGHFEADATAPYLGAAKLGAPGAATLQDGGADATRVESSGLGAGASPAGATPVDITRVDGAPAAGPPTGVPSTGGHETRPAGDQAARYQLIEELGRGGMGIVYRAEDRMLQRQVAYKVLPDDVLNPDITPDSLLAEARAAARLSHPNIVQVYDAGRHGSGFFIVMELVRGQTLESMLEQRALSIRGVIQVGRQILAALDHAHQRRLIHRDLKPSNLLWDEDHRLKLSDFGLARALEASSGNVRTQPAGTPSYMSPEQIRGEALSPSTDLYAFGCVLWEMLCRRPVFGTGAKSFHHHLSSPPSDPRTLREETPPALAELILECLCKDPSQRPKTAKEISKRLASMVA